MVFVFCFLLRNTGLHQLLPRALRTEHVGSVGDETLADQGVIAHGADEAVVVPVTILERYEARSANAGNGLGTGSASLGEELSEALSTVRLLVSRRESLSSKGSAAIGTGEALAVPRVVAVSHATGGDYLIALDASGSEFLFVASGTVYVVLPGDEAARSDGILADAAAEALVVPLVALVLHLLGASTEDIVASIATRCEGGVVAAGTVHFLRFGAERLVNQRNSALVAQETGLMPVLLLV